MAPALYGLGRRPRGWRCGWRRRLSHRLPGDPARRGMVSLGSGMDGIAQVAQQMPAVCDLDGIGCALTDPVGIDAGPVAGDHLDARVGLSHAASSRRCGRAAGRPRGCAQGRPAPSRSDGRGARPIHRRPAPARGGLGCGTAPAAHAIRSSVSALVGMARRAASRAPASPPSGEAEMALQLAQPLGPPRGSAARCGEALGEGPPGQAGLRQRKRRAWTRNEPDAPARAGREACGRTDYAPAGTARRRPGMLPRRCGATRMVRWSGNGRICWTSSPAGMSGNRRFGRTIRLQRERQVPP